MTFRSASVALGATLVALLAACSSTPRKQPAPATSVRAPATATAATSRRKSPYAPAQEDPSKRGNYTRGGLYAPGIRDSAPDGIPDVDQIPEPEVVDEPRSLYGNRSPYVVLGKSYTVLDDPSRYDEVGLASYYGNKFHGRRTSNLEVYDMYAFTAAHKTLPLPSFARVTNLSNGKSVIVRVNDRGPFHDGRIIDLSYAAAVKLGVDRAGTARVEVKGLSAGENARESSGVLAANPASPTAPPAASAIDHLLAALPIASADAAGHAPTVARTAATTSPPAKVAALPAARGERFDMRQDGRTMTADEFDAWMRARRIGVATGKPAPMPSPSAGPSSPSAPEEAAPPPAAAVQVAATAGNASPAGAATDAWTLQVASFAARTNAEHALAMLSQAGIGGARLLDADANGRKVWRLRVGPVTATAAEELIARIQGLGFGQPQRVRE
ncbi:septal ring lytic transglycosylase RlpA family protein [Cognatiluteimonas telluris]|uniref:septal ring lytic transglycosylase RlpA family protein n=1 Tax=Cognatiluteimonas telluris TaxID=1104775 RepID=UPI0014080FBF|nr:septal ring lytic transglycosylase RlpA family protein [Lysobacter telluris]